LRIQENHWVAHYSQILNNRHIFVVEFSHYGFDIILAFYINFKLLVKSVYSYGFYLKYNFLFSIFEVIELNIVNWGIGKLFNQVSFLIILHIWVCNILSSDQVTFFYLYFYLKQNNVHVLIFCLFFYFYKFSLAELRKLLPSRVQRGCAYLAYVFIVQSWVQ
jgi:hypothetical protein